MFAVVSRLKEPKRQGTSLMKKMRLYDGEDGDGVSPREVDALMEEFPDEGMEGISPRYVINRLSAALVRDGAVCLNPVDALKALKDGLQSHTSISRSEAERLENLIYDVKKEYDDMAKGELQKAFIRSFEDVAKSLFRNYLDHIEAFARKEKLRDPVTGDEVEPDEPFMRAIEEQIGITENMKKPFREEILIRLSSNARRGQTFDYTSHDRLRMAIEKKLFADMKNVISLTTSSRLPDPDQKRRLDEVAQRLVDEHGYCPICAQDLLAYAGGLLGR